MAMAKVDSVMVKLENQLVAMSTQVKLGDTVSFEYHGTIRAGKVNEIRRCPATGKQTIFIRDEDAYGPVYRQYNLSQISKFNLYED